MMKKGYISIELVIVAGVVLVFGLFAVNKFVKQGNNASTKMSNALEATLADIDKMDAQAGAIPDSGTAE